MLKVQEPASSQNQKPTKKIYSTPRLITHGDVAKLTTHHKPHHEGGGPDSELNS